MTTLSAGVAGGASSAAVVDAATGFGPQQLDALAASRRARQRRMAAVVLALPCLAYFAIELVYVTRLPLGMDEVHGAGAVYKLKSSVPYVDFVPYKNVLGYYVQLPFLLLGSGLWQQMLAVKLGMAALTALSMYAAAIALGRQLKLGAVLQATVLLCCMSTFLERSAELRVDMLTSLAGLGSLVAMLSGRFVLSGALAGISFLMSQKGIFFCAAGGVALLARFISPQRPRSALRDGALFGVAMVAPVALYFGLFSVLAPTSRVVEKSLGTARSMAMLELYRTLHRFWWQTANHNPLFYGLALLGLGAAFERSQHGRANDPAVQRDRIVCSYGATVLLLCFSHRQPWPYFFVMLIPTLWVVIAVTLDALPRRGLLFWAVFTIAGVIVPLGRSGDVLARDSRYLRYTIELADQLLAPGERYLAGMDMVYTHRQPGSLVWLDRRKLDSLRKRGPELMRELQDAPPKLVIWNYRIDGLPEPARGHLRAQYRQFWASVYTYAPTLTAEEFSLPYAGRYLLKDRKALTIDGRKIGPGKPVELSAGRHRVSRVPTRLQWVPPPSVQKRFDPKLRREQRLFDRVYDF